MAIFSLKEVRTEQIKNINDNNFESWPESATYGYFGGGAYPPLNPNYDVTIDRIDFSNETTSAPGYNLTQGRIAIAAVSSSSYGYFGGGFISPPLPSTYSNRIDRIDFSNETTLASGYNLTQGKTSMAATSSNSYGYFGGGAADANPGFTGTIERIDFSNDTTSPVTDTLSQARSNLAACSSNSYGYFGGGFFNPPPIYVSTIDRIDFSNETTSAPGYNLTQARSFIAAVSSSSYGYFGGGYAPPANIVATIDRIDFSNETTSPVTDTLSQARYDLAACSSNSYGYFGGGYGPGYETTVDRIDFSNETTSAPGYNLTRPRQGLAAASGGASYRIKGSRTYGYFGGGVMNSVDRKTIDRIDFSNETIILLTDKLSQRREYSAVCSSSSYGYFGGGYDPSLSTTVLATIDRIDFSNDTTSAPGYNLPEARGRLSACSSSSYGYFGAGFAPPPAVNYVATIDRIDFSNETTSAPGNNLPQPRESLAAVSNSSYGYFGGGNFEPPFLATIDRIDFLNETTSAPGYNLTQARGSLAALSSGSYGYFGGGGFYDGFFPAVMFDRIDRIDFSNETTFAPGNNLPVARANLAACSSSSYGYFSEGVIDPAPPFVPSTMDRIDFSNETTSAPGNNLTQGRYAAAATFN